MIEISVNMLNQTFKIIPEVLVICFIFEFLGSFFFNKK